MQPTNTEAIPSLEIEKKLSKVRSGAFSNFPKLFHGACVSDFFESYNYSFDDSVFIIGKCGTGKTHLAIAMMKKAYIDCIQKGMEYPNVAGLFYNFQDISIKIKSAFKSDSDSMQDVIRPLLSPAPRIIDDICTAKPTETAIEALYCVVNYRYENMLSTIYTTNLWLSEIAQQYGDRIASRLSACRMIMLNGKDRRQK